MAAEQAWDIDFTGTTVADADRDNALAPDGWYRAKLIGTSDDNDNGSKILEFQIIYGPLAGKKIREYLNSPKFAHSEAGAEFAKRKAKCYSARLGLVDESANNRTVSLLFGNAIGKEVIIKLTTRKGEKKDFQGIDFDIYPPKHPSLHADIYPKVGLVAPPEAPKGDEKASRAGAKDTTPAAAPTPAKNPDQMAAALWD